MPVGHLSESSVQELLDRAWSRGRVSVRARFDRLRSKGFLLAQCSVAAAVAWWFVTTVVGHPQGFFAPVVAILCLGMTYGQRLRRVVEVTIGVAVGVFVADVFVHVAGSGPWQVGAVAGTSMAIALLLDAGNLLVIQSAVQSIVVATLVSSHGQAFGRWLDAVVGGGVALVAATVVPQAPLRRPRVAAAAIVRKLADVLRGAASVGASADVDRAARVLASARDSDRGIRDLQEAADEGLSVVTSSPFRRAHREGVRTVADIIEPLDRAVRSSRVLARRIAVSAGRGNQLPAAYLQCLTNLADAVDLLGQVLATNQAAAGGRPALLRVAEETGTLARTEDLSAEVVLAQTRAMVVDLLQLTGLTLDEALAAMPPEPRH